MISLTIAMVGIASLMAVQHDADATNRLRHGWLHGQFEAFKQRFSRAYGSVDKEHARLLIFQANLARIEAHNANPSTWKMGVTKFSDLTLAEFQQLYAMRVPRIPAAHTNATMDHQARERAVMALLPTSIDWVSKGAVTAVKNQGQ